MRRRTILWMAMGLLCVRGVVAEGGDGKAAAGAAGLPAFAPRILFARQLPPDAIVEGILTKSDGALYLYRNPTRLERWERSISEKLNISRPGGRNDAPAGHLWNWEAQQRARQMLWILIAIGSAALMAVWMIARGIRRLLEGRRRSGTAFVRTRAYSPAGAAMVYRAPMARPAPPPPAGAATPENGERRADLTGSLSNIGLDAVLQVLAGIGKTGVLVIRDKEERVRGKISLKDGRLMEVSVGDERGVSAMVRILSMDAGFFHLRDLTSIERWRLRFHEATDLMALLLDAHRALDENAAGAASE